MLIEKALESFNRKLKDMLIRLNSSKVFYEKKTREKALFNATVQLKLTIMHMIIQQA